MKRFYSLLACLSLVVAASAQTWKLTEMTDETFSQGGDGQWSFEKYTYATGTYTRFLTYDAYSTVNYVDTYQPERVGGMLIQNLENVVAEGEFTWVYYTRKAWYDTEWTAPSRTEANEKFVYVSRLPELGNAFEVCGNQQYTPALSFTVPEDGFYKVSGNIIRQDGANLKAIHVVPRFRHAGTTEVDKDVTMGVAFPFGEGGEVIEGATNVSLANGAEQRYTAQEASDFTFAFRAKKGDIISFEVNYQSLATSAWPRDYYPRSFYRQLDVEAIDEATAKANENYVDPYDEGVLNALQERVDELTDQLNQMEYGTGVGMIPKDIWENMQAMLEEYTALIDDETINSTNAAQYLEQLEQAWARLQASVIAIDMTAEGNSYLFKSTIDEEGNYTTTGDVEVMAANDDNPWGFYARVVSNGTLEKFANHDESNLSGKNAWYRGANQWLYITDDGSMHPTTDRAPGILFNALEDGVYRLDLTLYRPNPNPSVENPLYLRWYHLYEDATTATEANRILSEQYGSVANDGEGGKKQISTAFYAYLKKGDRLFFEIDCYTANRNSSAGTQILNLSVATQVTDGEPISVQMAKNSGLLFLNPYAAGDCTELKATIGRANSILEETVNGNEPGQYPEEAREELQAAINDANGYIAQEGDPELTQSLVDQMTRELEKAIENYLNARIPVTLQPNGQYSIRRADTNKFLTRKDLAGDHYYAAVTDIAGIEADMAKNGKEIEQYTWTFAFTPVEDSYDVTITTEDGYMTENGYVVIGEPSMAPIFTLAKENVDDEVFAIRRSDGLYWSDSFTWKSPYDIISTSSSPLYIWMLDTATVTAIESTESSNTKPVKVELFDLSGRRLDKQSHGLVIRRTTYNDGSIKVEKLMK